MRGKSKRTGEVKLIGGSSRIGGRIINSGQILAGGETSGRHGSDKIVFSKSRNKKRKGYTKQGQRLHTILNHMNEKQLESNIEVQPLRRNMLAGTVQSNSSSKINITSNRKKRKSKKKITRMNFAIFRCPECGKLWRWYGGMQRHRRNVHGVHLRRSSFLPASLSRKNGPKIFCCPMCNDLFLSYRDLQSHLREVHDILLK